MREGISTTNLPQQSLSHHRPKAHHQPKFATISPATNPRLTTNSSTTKP
ncbi:MAG: hypothetical protein LUD39_03880 [Opitutae bacterium]|nr:hypothetical protein [Opitutae bacterium]